MRTYTIYIDGYPYLGEHPDETYFDTEGDAWSNNSFRTHREPLNVLLLGAKSQPPKNIMGDRGLRCEIDKIMRRVEYGLIKVGSMTITTIDDTPFGGKQL